jgi:hypothetical protein
MGPPLIPKHIHIPYILLRKPGGFLLPVVLCGRAPEQIVEMVVGRIIVCVATIHAGWARADEGFKNKLVNLPTLRLAVFPEKNVQIPATSIFFYPTSLHRMRLAVEGGITVIGEDLTVYANCVKVLVPSDPSECFTTFVFHSVLLSLIHRRRGWNLTGRRVDYTGLLFRGGDNSRLYPLVDRKSVG